MTQHRYGVKIPWPDIGETWVTDHGPALDMRPKLFDTFLEAENFAENWGTRARVEQYTTQ
jgi:hypothetical protein